MGKLVVLKFTDGSFEAGFSVTLQIGEERDRPTTEITGKLPPCPEMHLYYSHWQSSYRQLGNPYRLDAEVVQVTNVSMTQDCHHTSHVLQARFNTWLKAEEFRALREKWLERLLPTDEVRVILQAENHQLQRLPWHLWDLLERYPKAEIALSSPTYDRLHKPPTPKRVVNILAIVGNSQGIDTKVDQAILQKYTNANIRLLLQPQRQALTDQLWEQNWDILFFAGHSYSHDNSGRIYLNKTDSLSINELRYALKKAIERGLQIAIFNSCDGLGLAWELADLQIPQVIFMREPVPDQVAHEFLKYFLISFAGGDSLYQAVRQGRERLQGLEDQFPCATWLPVICQNPAQIPPTWEQLTGRKKPDLAKMAATKRQLSAALFSSMAIAALVCSVRFLGLLQSIELQAFDQMMRSRPPEGPDPRLLVVTIDDADLAIQRQNGETLKGTSLSDRYLQKLLTKLQQYQPRVIGLDIYRDFAAEQPDLIASLQQTQNLIGVCKGSDTVATTRGIAPPPEIPIERQGFSDFIQDADGVVRRHLIYLNQEAASLCTAPYALSMQVAFRYLQSLGIQIQYTPQMQIGNKVIQRLKSRTGGYQSIEPYGQILLNYRSTRRIAEQVTLTQFLSNHVSSKAIKNKIVLIGVTAKGDLPDYWPTPYGYIDQQMPGVIVHAHMVSQILGHVLDERPLLRVWPLWMELLWISGWSLVGGISAWRLSSPSILGLAVIITFSTVYLCCFGLLIGGIWIPFVPAVFSLLGATGVTAMQKVKGQILDVQLLKKISSC